MIIKWINRVYLLLASILLLQVVSVTEVRCLETNLTPSIIEFASTDSDQTTYFSPFQDHRSLIAECESLEESEEDSLEKKSKKNNFQHRKQLFQCICSFHSKVVLVQITRIFAFPYFSSFIPIHLTNETFLI